jgi:hypothetical protein
MIGHLVNWLQAFYATPRLDESREQRSVAVPPVVWCPPIRGIGNLDSQMPNWTSKSLKRSG